ncbi:hypothetical protein XENTR_v10019677 [Xenopus tropicalis]|nr:hypothetical protein XENTR_v10019677 [Xenopus tropicalis]
MSFSRMNRNMFRARDLPPVQERGDVTSRVSVAYSLLVQGGVNTRHIPFIPDHHPIQEEGGNPRTGQTTRHSVAQEGVYSGNMAELHSFHLPVQEEGVFFNISTETRETASAYCNNLNRRILEIPVAPKANPSEGQGVDSAVPTL